ncbi:MAG: hypothetical protein HY906_21290 [Deltaproteobacteria bacterium]|nr:hypothetical protein [Deltaproteobacteria bacterium]
MSDLLDLDDPTATILAVVRSLREAGIESAVYGGLALAAYGEPRETKDADVAVCGTGAPAAVDALRRGGLDCTVAFDRVRFGGHTVTRVTLLGGSTATGLNVAGLVEPRSARYARASLERAVPVSLRGQMVRVLSPEDFVVFKVLSTRERDLEDAATVLRVLAGRLDLGAIGAEAACLGAEIPDHDVAGRLARATAQAAE